VVHVEAGLRTADRYNPFPEEINRRLTSQVASLHLAPTRTSRANLVAENIKPEHIAVTGNTVIDALLDVVARRLPYDDAALEQLADRRTVLITAHRRESWARRWPVRAGGAPVGSSLSGRDVRAAGAPQSVVREVLLPRCAAARTWSSPSRCRTDSSLGSCRTATSS